MAKTPSPATEIRSLKRRVQQLAKDLAYSQDQERSWRGRATRAEQERAAWERRFDALLARTPEEPRG